MGVMKRVKGQATQLAQKSQEAAREGRVKLDQVQARRRADALFRALGAAVFAERTGQGDPDTTQKIERLVRLLSEQEASIGLGDNGERERTSD
jgi:hypothetical protein